MPQDPEHGQRFAEDMRRIREAHHLTVGDVQDETKIPQGLIEAFEDKALFDHPQFNRVYLRSFVRTYAQVVNIDPDAALEGLEEALSGRYAGSLAVEYLGDEPAGAGGMSKTEEAPPDVKKEAEEEAAAADPPEQRAEQEPEEAKSKETPPPKTSKKTTAAPPPGHGEASRAAADETSEQTEEQEEAAEADDGGPSYVSTTQATAAGFQETAEEEENLEDEPAGDWAAQSPPTASAASETRRAPSRSSGLDRRWVLGGALVVVVGVLVWILASVLGGSDAPETGQTIAADTTQTVESPDTAAMTTPSNAPANIPALGDTMNVHIVAANGKVDPIRVTIDDDLRRPYWIEEGDSMAFRPTSRIVVEELLDSVNVKIEGIEYPMDRRDDQGRIVITRDAAQSYFASLRGGQ